MRNKLKVWIWMSIIFVLLIVVAAFGTLTDSGVHDFPIPSNAELEDKHSEMAYTYSWKGITSFYLFRVQFMGWKKVEQEGSRITFQRDDKRVYIIPFTDGFEIVGD